LRINPVRVNRAFGLKMGGRPVQFGIDEEDLPDAERAVLEHLEEIDFRGIHVYAGSQCFEPDAIMEGVRDSLRIAREIENRTGLPCSKINLGGGFGVGHGQDARELDIAKLAEPLIPVLRAFVEESRTHVDLMFELGRFLIAVAGIYVTRVIGSKLSRGKLFFACDGGLNQHLAAAGTFGAALRSNFALRNLTQPNAPPVVCSLCGPSCNPTDLLGVDVSLPKPTEGDLIGILNSGSYGLTASPILFLGHRTPVELVRYGVKFAIGRRAFNVTEFN
jgi:diaminopimelate decarboxylase